MMNLVGPLIDHEEWLDAATITARALRVRPQKPLILQKAEVLLKVLFERRKLSEAEILLSTSFQKYADVFWGQSRDFHRGVFSLVSKSFRSWRLNFHSKGLAATSQ